MVHLLAQPQQELQLSYKTNITPNHLKIKLYGNLTTKVLKKSHSLRRVEIQRHGDMEWAGPTPSCCG